MLEVNGFLMDIRSAPRELQEVAFEKGLIPYIPADRSISEEEVVEATDSNYKRIGAAQSPTSRAFNDD